MLTQTVNAQVWLTLTHRGSNMYILGSLQTLHQLGWQSRWPRHQRHWKVKEHTLELDHHKPGLGLERPARQHIDRRERIHPDPRQVRQHRPPGSLLPATSAGWHSTLRKGYKHSTPATTLKRT